MIRFMPVGVTLFVLASAASAQAVRPAPANGPDVRAFECSADSLTADLQLRAASDDAASDFVSSMRVNGRHLDPAALRYVNTLAAGRTIDRVASECRDKSLIVDIHLAPSPADKREKITVTARGTTVKVQ